MREYSSDVPTTATSLFNLMGGNDLCRSIAICAPTDNTNNLNYGATQNVPAEIVPGGYVALPHRNLRDIFVKGESGDSLVIFAF
jgi:hypothetical protein